MYVERQGFANHYFNQVERDRVMSVVRTWGGFTGLDGLWTLSGKTLDGRAFQFKLGAQSIGVELGRDVSVQPLTADFSDAPAGSGGLLAALQQLRLLLSGPEEHFSEFYYLGSEPLDGLGERADVLVTTKGEVSSRWYFSRADGRWLGFDTALAEDVDECEVRIESLRAIDGRTLPERFTVRRAGEPFATFVIESATLE
jgi:hypothetical protein